MIFKTAIVLCLLTLTNSMHQRPAGVSTVKRWIVSESSNLTVNGSTNINKFSCAILSYNHQDTLTIIKGSIRAARLTGSISLDVKSFDCHNSPMTRQLQKTLKEKQFPLLKIRFLSLSEFPDLATKPEHITGMVNIDIAGAGKQFLINCYLNEDSGKTIHLLGQLDINFSDFNLIPPSKLGGIIKAKNQLKIIFNLDIKAGSV